MKDIIDLSVEMQKRVIDAHEKSMEAARDALKTGDAALKVQKAMADATQANMSMWKKWMELWGWSR